MTVKELIVKLLELPPNAEVRANFDVSDHETSWEIYDVDEQARYWRDDSVVLIKAK